MAAELGFQSERIFDLLVKGFSYLAKTASRKGHWNEVRSTALAGMCLQLRETGGSPWLACVKDWLVGEQMNEGAATGSWGEEVWDTAMCLIALKDLESSSRDPVVDRGLKWMASLYSVNGRDDWHDEPWETSWALIAFLRCGRSFAPVNISKAMRWLVSLQTGDGRIVSPHYTAYFVLIEHLTSKANLLDEDRAFFRAARDRCRDYLLRLVRESGETRLWAGEGWINGQILWALCSTSQFPIEDDKLVGSVIAWFEKTQSGEGNWSDVEDTASAILGLHRLLCLLAHSALKQDKRIKDIDGLIESRLQKAVRLPRLRLKRKLLERDPDTGYLAINIREATLKFWVAVLVFLFVGVVGWIANVIQLFQSILN